MVRIMIGIMVRIMIGIMSKSHQYTDSNQGRISALDRSRHRVYWRESRSNDRSSSDGVWRVSGLFDGPVYHVS